ncbi:MAG: NADPH-dependent FMN reductase [Myxococcota bacterium]
MTLKLTVFYGSVRTKRAGIRAARFITEYAKSRGHDANLVDPIEVQLPLLDKMYKEYDPGEAPPALEKLAEQVASSDGYIVVTGEYNHSPPPGLLNLLDHFLEQYFFKPSGIVSYSAGSFGGVRASIALRSLLAELGMSSIPSVLPVPRVQDAFTEEGQPVDAAWNRRADRFMSEFEWYCRALKEAREKDEPPGSN